MVDSIDFLAVVADVLRVQVDDVDEHWDLTSSSGRYTYHPLQKTDVGQVLGRLESVTKTAPVALASPNAFEILLTQADEARTPLRNALREEPFTLADSDNGLNYVLGVPSREMICHVLLRLHADLGSRHTRQRVRPPFALSRDGVQELDPWDVLSDICRRFVSLQISSSAPRTAEKFSNYVDSMLFHMAFNLDFSLVSVASPADAFLDRTSWRTTTRSEHRDLEPPHLLYQRDLVHRYIAALSSGDAVSRFLGIYQIAEHHFDRLYNKFIVDQVRDQLVSPAFSLRRDDDIQKLVRSVTKLVRERQNETSSFDEQKAMLLTLETFVQLPRLVESLESIDPSLIEYYKHTEVQFSRGDVVDLANSDALPSLGRRIYKTWNAVVHAKTGDKGRFRHGLDDAALKREIPLMRAIAEEVLIASATMLE